MYTLVNVYCAYLKLSLLKQMQYRAELLIWLINRVLEPVIYLVVWTAVARANGGSVDGFTPADFAAYFIAEMLVIHATSSAIMWEYEYRVQNGTLSSMLLRPLHPIHADLAECLANKLLTSLVMLPTAFCLVLAFRPALYLSLGSILAFVPTLFLAFALRFLLEWTLSMVALWTTRVTAINYLYFSALLFLSGEVAPIALLPAPLQTLAMLLPFRWFVAFPIEVLLNRLASQEVLTGLAAQGFWLICMMGVLMLVWRVGLRRYSAVGA